MANDANNAPTDYLYIPYNPLIFSNNIHLLVEMLELRAVLDTLIVTTHTQVDFPHQHPTQSHHNDSRKEYRSYTRKPYHRAHHDDAARATPFNKQPTTLLQVTNLSQRTYGRTNVYCTAHIGNQPVTVGATNLSANVQPESNCSLQDKRRILVGKNYTTHTAIVGIHRRRRRRGRK